MENTTISYAKSYVRYAVSFSLTLLTLRILHLTVIYYICL
nr:MAG TPA: hypothetical protein [Caudoviricetes sp.]